ncbi:hypothetical protein Tco_1101737 [Tanacetum coccineum]
MRYTQRGALDSGKDKAYLILLGKQGEMRSVHGQVLYTDGDEEVVGLIQGIWMMLDDTSLIFDTLVFWSSNSGFITVYGTSGVAVFGLLGAIDLKKELIQQETKLESDGDDDLPEVADPDNVA